MRRSRTRVAVGVTTFLAVIVAALLTLPFALPFFVLRPTPLEPSQPARWGLAAARSVRFAAVDGSQLSGWWIPPRSAAEATIILMHGRSANVSTRAPIARRLHDDGFGVLLFDYRDYGGSEGSATERALSEDSLSAYEWTRRQAIDPNRIILIGQSLGNAPAAHVASMRPVAGLVLVSPFINFPEAAADRLPWLPLRLVPWTRNRFEVAGKLRRLAVPLVLVASRADELVPIDHARRVEAAARGPVRWIELSSAPHNGLLEAAAESGALTQALRTMLTDPG